MGWQPRIKSLPIYDETFLLIHFGGPATF